MTDYTWEQLMIPGLEWEHTLVLGAEDTLVGWTGRTIRGPKTLVLWQVADGKGIAWKDPQLTLGFE